MPNGHPTFWLIAEPNGVGKTIYAMRHFRAVLGSINLVNLGEIARGLSPLDPSAAQTDAARVALSRTRGFMQVPTTFAMETILSGRTHRDLLEEASHHGLAMAILYLSVRSPDICLERSARRVAEGGHDVSEPIVRRRFERGLANLPSYRALRSLARLRSQRPAPGPGDRRPPQRASLQRPGGSGDGASGACAPPGRIAITHHAKPGR